MSDSAVQIQNLIYRYAELIDLGDFDALGDLLSGAEVGAGGSTDSLTGYDAVVAMFTSSTRRYDDGTPRTKHVTTNLILEVDEDAGAATCRSYFTVLQQVPAQPLQPVIAGRYHDRFTRTDDKWQFAERRFLIDLVGDLSQHLLSPLPDEG